MASLRRLPKSPYWIACFTLPDGTRTQRSTRVPFDGVKKTDLGPLQKLLDDLLGGTVTIPESATPDSVLDAREARRLAQRIATQFEDAARQARIGYLSELQARKVIAHIYSLGNKEALGSSTIKDYCGTWLKRKELESGERTHERYATVIEQLLSFLGTKADRDLAQLTSNELVDFRDHLAKRVAPSTANLSVKIIRVALGQARRDGLVDVNQAERVSLLKRHRGGLERRAFTLDELRRILAVANDEWRGMVLTGLYSGLRLGDVATLTWANVDLQQQQLIVTTQKTGRRQVLPLASPLLRHLESLPGTDDPNGPLFPQACELKQRSSAGGPLSNQFYNILVAAGLAQARTHKSQGKGRNAARNTANLGYHCLRHTATSLLKNAGVSDAVAQDIIGHESAAISRQYTHIDDATKRAAVNLLPDVTAQPTPS